MRSALRTIFSRCETITVVRPIINLRSASSTSASVPASRPLALFGDDPFTTVRVVQEGNVLLPGQANHYAQAATGGSVQKQRGGGV